MHESEFLNGCIFSCLLRIEHDVFLHLHGSFWLNFPYTRCVCGRDSQVERCLSDEDDADDGVGGEQHGLCLFFDGLLFTF